MDSLRIFQIYFDEASRENCFTHPVVTPYFNPTLTPYFENQIILDLAPYGARYVGVWSHKAGRKLLGAGNQRIDLDEIGRLCATGGFDVLGFHPRRNLFPARGRQIIFEQRRTKARFDSMFDYLMRKLQVAYDSQATPRFIVMGNHFIASSAVMNGYCAFLQRAKLVMDSDEALKTELERRPPYKPESAIRYTYHPFICEKLFSAYLTLEPEIDCRLYADGGSRRW